MQACARELARVTIGADRRHSAVNPRTHSLVALLALALLVWPRVALGQGAERLRFKHLTVEQGLSHGTVKAVLQDSRGFMWLGTWGGLDRYDGYEVVSFRQDSTDPESLSGNTVNALLEDSSGALWVATSSGLSRLDHASDTFTNYRHDPDDPDSLGSDEVWSLLEDSGGALWALTLGGGLNRFDPPAGGEAPRFRRYLNDPADPHSLSANSGRAIFEDHLGYLWIGTPEDGLNRFDRETGEVLRYRHDARDPHSLAGDDVWSVFEDHLHALWVGTRTRGLSRFDRETGRFSRYAPEVAGGFIFDVTEDGQSTLWVASYDAGLHRYDRRHDRFIRYLPDAADRQSLSHFQLLDLYEDRAGALWISTFGGGVDRLDREAQKFNLYQHFPDRDHGLGGKDVRAMHVDAGGIFWIGTYDGGLTRFDRPAGAFRTYRHDPDDRASLSDNRIQTLHEDREGRIWIGTWGGGLNRFDRRTGAFSHFRHDPEDPLSLSDDDVRGIHQGPDGRLWIATGSAGLNALDARTETFTRFPQDPDDPESVNEGVIFSLHGDNAAGILWLGVWGGGLHRFDMSSGKVKRYEPDAGDPAAISSSEVWSILPGSSGELWLGTGAGLNRFDPETQAFTVYRERDGLASDAVYSMVDDDRGRLWIATGAGLSRFDPATREFRNYTADDGFQSGILVDGCAYRTDSGELFFGGQGGLNYFHPDEVADNPHLPQVVITDFQIFNRPVEVGAPGSPLAKTITETDRISLDYDQSVLSFGFAALSFRAPHRNRYAYKLEGLEESWNYVDSRRRYATYTNLDPGVYTLRVKGSNNDGVWNPTPRSLEIRVRPPFWGTWTFRVSAALALVGLVWGGYLMRTTSIRARNRALAAEIRERQRAEAERDRLIAELGEKNDLLRHQNAELESFTYSVSHDLKTPLVTIKGFLGLLKDDVAAGRAEAAARDAQVIDNAANKMYELLEDVLELSRVGRVVHPSEAVPLADLAREAAELVATPIHERGVELTIDPSMPEIRADRRRLLQAMQNLIGNAVKFMGEQAAPRVEIGAEMRGDEVLCYVRDNGIGIDPDYHEKVFGLFDRLDPAVRGTGIGLALVKRIVEIHGGEIWIESDGKNQGTTFFFTLPTHPPAARRPR